MIRSIIIGIIEDDSGSTACSTMCNAASSNGYSTAATRVGYSTVHGTATFVSTTKGGVIEDDSSSTACGTACSGTAYNTAT